MIWIEGLEIPLPGRSGLIFASHNLTTAFYFAQFTRSSHKHAASFKVGPTGIPTKFANIGDTRINTVITKDLPHLPRIRCSKFYFMGFLLLYFFISFVLLIFNKM